MGEWLRRVIAWLCRRLALFLDGGELGERVCESRRGWLGLWLCVVCVVLIVLQMWHGWLDVDVLGELREARLLRVHTLRELAQTLREGRRRHLFLT